MDPKKRKNPTDKLPEIIPAYRNVILIYTDGISMHCVPKYVQNKISTKHFSLAWANIHFTLQGKSQLFHTDKYIIIKFWYFFNYSNGILIKIIIYLAEI